MNPVPELGAAQTSPTSFARDYGMFPAPADTTAGRTFPQHPAESGQLSPWGRTFLRGQLHVILGFAALLVEDPELNDGQRHYAKQVHAAGEELLRLLHQTAGGRDDDRHTD